MKLTVIFVTLFSISWALKVPNAKDPKDKREAPVGYPSNGHSHSYSPSYTQQEDANAISIGAGYSVGGGKPSFSYGAPESSGHLQLSSESLPPSGHATIQLQPIQLHDQGNYASSDLNQLMSQLSHGLNSGALTLSPYQNGGQNIHGGQQISIPQYSFGKPELQQYAVQEQGGQSVPSYAIGSKGLGSYGSTGPVLFSPESQSQHGLSYGSPSGAGQSFDVSALSFGSGPSLSGLSLGEPTHGGAGLSIGDGGHGLPAKYALVSSEHSFDGIGHSLGGSGHSFGGAGHSLGGSGHSLGGSGYSLGAPGHSLGGSGHSFGGLVKSYGGPGKASFKPSTFIGSHGEAGHGILGLSGGHGAPSFGSHSLSGGHGGLTLSSAGHGPSFGSPQASFGGGSSKFIAPNYLPPKTKGYASLDSVSAFSSGSHASPPRTTYGVPASSYSGGPATSSHSASSHSPQYYVASSKFPSFSDSSSSFKAPSGHNSLSSFSSGPKFSFGGHSSPNSRYGSPKDAQGSYSETSYNTIKYSEELKPRMQ